MPFYLFFWEGSPTRTDYSKKGTRILTSLLEDLVTIGLLKGPCPCQVPCEMGGRVTDLSTFLAVWEIVDVPLDKKLSSFSRGVNSNKGVVVVGF